ncbi:MFS transporter [Chloroflexota bacterium]
MMTQAKELTYSYRWVIIGVLFTAYIVIFMHRLGIGPLAPFIKEQLDLTYVQVGSLMSAASFGYALSIIPAGWAVDRIGIRRLLLIGELVGGIFMLGMFFASSYEAALVIMVMSGIGCGCLMPVTTKGVIVWFPIKERATAMGLKQTGINIGGIITAAVLPGVALTLGWRFGFLFLGILAIIIGIVSSILYKDPPSPAKLKSKDSTTNIDVAEGTAGQSLSMLFKTRDIWVVSLAGLTFAIAEFAVIAHLVIYLTEEWAFSAVTAGMILAMFQAGGIPGKLGAGLLSDRLFGGSRRNILVLLGGGASAMCIIIPILGTSLSWALYPIILILGVTAFGWGGVLLTLVAELAGKELAGTATGAAGVVITLGATLGPILFGYLIDSSGSYQLAWFSIAVCSALGAIALLAVREERRRI